MSSSDSDVVFLRRLRSHRTKVTILVVGALATGHGALQDNMPLLVVGTVLALFALMQLHQYWGTHEFD